MRFFHFRLQHSGFSLLLMICSRRSRLFFLVPFLGIALICNAASSASSPSPYGRWSRGLPTNDTFFPIAVWLQNPSNAERFKAAGINVYVGLHRGPTSNHLALLEKAGMRVICSQNRGLEFKDHPMIAGWMHGDEPDNAQSLGDGKGYGPPILPQKIIEDYQRLRAADPSRPIFLNLGQGVAWDNWIGRGVRRNHPEDYPEYLKGCDIASFDIYPVVHDHRDVQGKLEFVAHGVDRLRKWAGPERVVWNCIECTHIENPDRKATPSQVRSEVWMSLIRGSRGLIYFVHQFKPVFREAALLDDPEMLKAVTHLNRQIHQLAPVLNSPSITNGLSFKNPAAESSIAWMIKRHEKKVYLFTANLNPKSAEASFVLSGFPGQSKVEVLEEGRGLEMKNGSFTDQFEPYGVHLYQIELPGK